MSALKSAISSQIDAAGPGLVWGQTDFAIINGKRGITGDSALRLAHWFRDTLPFRMNRQVRCHLGLAEAESGCAIRSLPTTPTVRGHKATRKLKMHKKDLVTGENKTFSHASECVCKESIA